MIRPLTHNVRLCEKTRRCHRLFRVEYRDWPGRHHHDRGLWFAKVRRWLDRSPWALTVPLSMVAVVVSVIALVTR